jgi:hypothetical protein
MKLQPGKRKKTQGNMILLCVMFSFILGITIASYLDLVKEQYNTTLRSHDWNAGMVLAEAGIEDGMAFINKYAGNYGSSQNWADTAAADGWQPINGNVYYVRRTPDATLGCYDVWVTNNANSITVCSVGSAFWNQQPVTGPQIPSSAPGIATSGSDNGAIVRQVLVQTTNDPLFSVAAGCTGAINLNGYTLNADSFDSGDTNHSVWNSNLQYWVYSPALHKSDGVVATDDAITNVGSPGNTLIYGSVITGPGGETNIAQNGSVGDTNWVPTPGIQPGHSQDDMNVIFQNVLLPPENWSQLGPNGGLGPISPPGGYSEYSGSSGLMHSLLVTAPNVVLYLVNGVDYGNSGNNYFHRTITITNGSSAIIYVGQNFNLGTSGNIINNTGNATNLCIYGLTNLTSISLGNVSNFVGTIYAPQADLVLGNDDFTTQITGSIIAHSITLNGNVAFHYDENLRRVGPCRAFVPISWTEF